MSIIDEVRAIVPRGNISGQGWHNFNCPSCGDSRGRGGVLFTEDGFIYRCFDGGCTYNLRNLGWRKGGCFGRRQKEWFQLMGGDVRDLPIKEVQGDKGYQAPKDNIPTFTEFKTFSMPDNWQILWDSDNEDVKQYLMDKTNGAVQSSNILYDPSDPSCYIVPFTHKKEVVGYVKRDITARKGEKRMNGYAPPQYMAGQDRIFDKGYKYLIVVESPLDAMMLKTVGVRSNVLTKSQVKLLRMSRMTIVMVPDYNRKEAAGFIKVAQENDWYLSAPFSKDIRFKDIGDVIKYGGMLFTIERILAERTKRLVLMK